MRAKRQSIFRTTGRGSDKFSNTLAYKSRADPQLRAGEMEFGSEFVFAPTSSAEEGDYEAIPEARYNHVVTGYSSGASPASSLPDDGEVRIVAFSAVTKR